MCGSCPGGKPKTVFGKVSSRVCVCTFRFAPPSEDDLAFMKIMIDMQLTAR